MSAGENDHLLLTFHSNIKDLLYHTFRQDPVVRYPLSRNASIKDIIEALGIPHTEIGSIEKNLIQLDFSYIPQPGDRLDISPIGAGTGATEPSVLRPRPPKPYCFMVDINVARLTGLLRMAGFDTLSVLDLADLKSKRDIAETSSSLGRILLSRDKELLKHREVTFGRLVRAQDPESQLYEIITLYNLQDKLSPFSRCMKCNTILVEVAKQSVLHRLEPLTEKYYDSFKRCGSCSSIYWRGSHHQKMLKLLEPILTDTGHQ